jgi:hypothetical protein
MMRQTNETTLIARVLPDIFAFGLGLGLAWFLNWETRDLVWSLWLCSLALGYLTLFTAIGGGAWIGFSAVQQEGVSAGDRLKAIAVGLPVVLFLVGFFSVHFGGFHAGHSVFLQQFFPVEGVPEDGFGRAFMNPPLLWKLAFTHLMAPYGLFLIPAVIAERHHLLTPVVRMKRAASESGGPAALFAGGVKGKTGKKAHPIGEAMGRPYINVVRMHLLIFFFAFSHAIHLDSFLIYAVVYSVYFFPWRELRRPATQQPLPFS